MRRWPTGWRLRSVQSVFMDLKTTECTNSWWCSYLSARTVPSAPLPHADTDRLSAPRLPENTRYCELQSIVFIMRHWTVARSALTSVWFAVYSEEFGNFSEQLDPSVTETSGCFHLSCLTCDSFRLVNMKETLINSKSVRSQRRQRNVETSPAAV